MADKLFTRKEIAEKISALQQAGKIIGFTSGAFDILHAGHVEYLEEAKKN